MHLEWAETWVHCMGIIWWRFWAIEFLFYLCVCCWKVLTGGLLLLGKVMDRCCSLLGFLKAVLDLYLMMWGRSCERLESGQKDNLLVHYILWESFKGVEKGFCICIQIHDNALFDGIAKTPTALSRFNTFRIFLNLAIESDKAVVAFTRFSTTVVTRKSCLISSNKPQQCSRATYRHISHLQHHYTRNPHLNTKQQAIRDLSLPVKSLQNQWIPIRH